MCLGFTDINAVTVPAIKKFRRCKETKRGAVVDEDWSPSVVARRLPGESLNLILCRPVCVFVCSVCVCVCM